MNIFVGNLAKEVTDQELEKVFSQFGYVKSAKVIRDMFSGESKGFGFVEMPGKAEATTAMNELNTFELKGKKLNVNEARPRGERTSRGGGGDTRKKTGGFSNRRF